ncbi:AAA family ATPase [Sedimentibacter sp. zth1]|uniref:AAA family ATPase n=1 Tax=Sedimentibacter sp. zth1 TaxID=2816908 RepID=UPI001A91A544|nr:AAA family ATPase [Sedimentibacter sp. zth1]QSX04896.1 AAA family ATPase [Sedimentibacter sp. zth1]
MFIKELDLKFFGKFKYKKFMFKNGLNIIYGNNEAGKSTMHNFIEIMLFGFKNGKDENDEKLFHKYRPWNSDQYLGALTIEEKDKDYIVKKDFYTKDYKLFSKLKNSNTEKLISIDDKQEVGEYLFGIDKSTFVNTLSIKQLSNSTNEELAAEVKEKIVNLSQSKDETISLDKILKILEAIKDEAGYIDNPKSLVSQYNSRVEELKKQKNKTLESKKYTLHLAMEKKKKQNMVEILDEEIKTINNELEAFRISLLASKKAKADEVYNEIAQIKNELLQYGEGNNIGIDDYEEALKLITVLNSMKTEKKRIEEEMIEINRDMVLLEKESNYDESTEAFLTKLNIDYKTYNEAIQSINELQEKINQGTKLLEQNDLEEINKFEDTYNKANNNELEIVRINNLKNDSTEHLVTKIIKGSKVKKVLSICFGILFLLIASGAAFAGYYFENLIYYYGASVSIISIILFIIASKANTKLKGLNYELLTIKSEQEELADKLKACIDENSKIYTQNKCSTIIELKKKYDYNNSVKEIALEKQKLLEFDNDNLKNAIKNRKIIEEDLLSRLVKYNIFEVTDESVKKVSDIVLEKDRTRQEINKKSILLDKLQQNYRNIEKELDYEQKRCNIILTTNNIKCIDEFKSIVNNNYKISQLKDKIVGLERIIDNILDNYTYEQITNILDTHDTINLSTINNQSFNEEQKFKEIQNKEEMKVLIKKEIDSIDSNIESIEEVEKRLVSIEEEIEFYEDKIKEGTEKVKIADIAMQNIMLISDYIKGDFVPLLKSAISDNFKYVTSGNYKEVLIDEDMNISVVNKDNEIINDLNSLSGGTLDQLYISLRLGLSNLISDNKKIPLILDDSFIQYDENRLKKSLEMLSKESRKRQVILFTCQQREINIVKELGIECNIITIIK